MEMDKKRALKQFKEIEKRAEELRLAADGWDKDWKILIATLMSARTLDRTTIPVAEKLFSKYSSVEKLAKANVEDIAAIIRPVNFYKGKAERIKKLANILINDYEVKAPHDFDKLMELPGVGRKTANVFLAEQGHNTIGVDVHVNFMSKYMGWTKSDKQEQVEEDLKKIFPESQWGNINWVLVRFGQTYPNRKKRVEVLKGIKKIR